MAKQEKKSPMDIKLGAKKVGSSAKPSGKPGAGLKRKK